MTTDAAIIATAVAVADEYDLTMQGEMLVDCYGDPWSIVEVATEVAVRLGYTFTEELHPREHGRFAPKEMEQPAKEPGPHGYTPIDWSTRPLPDSPFLAGLSQVQRDAIDWRLGHFALPVKDADGNIVGHEIQGPYVIDAAAYQRVEDAIGAAVNNEPVYEAMATWYADVNDTAAWYSDALRAEGGTTTPDEMMGLIAAMSAQTPWTTENANEPQNLEMAVGYARLWDSNPIDEVTGKDFQHMTPEEAVRFLHDNPDLQHMPPFASEIARIGTGPGGAHGGTPMVSHIVNAQRVMQSDGTTAGVHSALGGEKYLAFHDQIVGRGTGARSVNDSHMAAIVLGDPSLDGHLMDGPKGIGNDFAAANGMTPADKTEARAGWTPGGTAYAAIGSVVEAVSIAHDIPIGVGQALAWGSDVANPETSGGNIRGL